MAQQKFAESGCPYISIQLYPPWFLLSTPVPIPVSNRIICVSFGDIIGTMVLWYCICLVHQKGGAVGAIPTPRFGATPQLTKKCVGCGTNHSAGHKTNKMQTRSFAAAAYDATRYVRAHGLGMPGMRSWALSTHDWDSGDLTCASASAGPKFSNHRL